MDKTAQVLYECAISPVLFAPVVVIQCMLCSQFAGSPVRAHTLSISSPPADIDECSDGTDNCEQTCTNTPGSFVCGCFSGFSLDANGVNCTGRSILYEHAFLVA